MDEFTIDDERFAEALAKRAALDEIEVADIDLDSWGGESLTTTVAAFVGEMQAKGGLVRAGVAGEPMDLVIYSHDDDSGVGYMVAVRPANAARASKLIPSGAQIASYIDDTDGLVGRDDDGMLGAVGPDALREVLVACAEAGNVLLPALRRLAGDDGAHRAAEAIQALLSKDEWSGADDMQEIAEILAR
ncbi:MAG: hypothetical protein ACYCTE_12735, partial [Acidimicrobiales bacterium]